MCISFTILNIVFACYDEDNGKPNDGDIHQTETAVVQLNALTPRSLTPTSTTLIATPGPLQAELERAQNFSGSNTEWEELVQEIDGVEMVLVPAGCFLMGSTMGEEDEKPVHQVCFKEPFWIDQFEVTNAQFSTESGVAREASHSTLPDFPRTKITWQEASTYCLSRNARLPTEAEWEYAARGPSGWTYPWGDSFSVDKVIFKITVEGLDSAAVGSRTEGASWVGAQDMSGNVWEWTADTYVSPYPDGDQTDPLIYGEGNDRSVRGGSWSSDKAENLRAANRFRANFQRFFLDIDFRCVRSIA